MNRNLMGRLFLWFLSAACVTTVSAASGAFPVWLLDDQNLYQLDAERAELRQVVQLHSGMVVGADANGNAWVLTADQLQRWEGQAQAAGSPKMVQSISLIDLGANQARELRVDPTDASVWLADDEHVWHVASDGKLLGTQLAAEPLRDIAIGWDKTLWLLGDKTLRQVESLESGGRLLNEVSFAGQLEQPTHFSLDPLHHAVWLVGPKWLSRVDWTGEQPRLNLVRPPNVLWFAVEPQSGTLWLLTPTALSAYRVDGTPQSVISLATLGIQGAKQFSPDPSGRHLWVHHGQGITRVDTTTATVVTFKKPELKRIRSLAAAPFSASPVLGLSAPKTSDLIVAGTTFSFEAGVLCKSSACYLPPEYYGSLDVRALLNGTSLGVLVVDPTTHLASASLGELPENSGDLHIEAVATDVFGRQSVPLSLRLPAQVKKQQQLGGENYFGSTSKLLNAPSIDKVASATPTSRAVSNIINRLPLTFEANQGQYESGVQYVSRGRGYHLSLGKGEAVLHLRRGEKLKRSGINVGKFGGLNNTKLYAKKPESGDVIRVSFPGANTQPRMVPEQESATKSHYLIGQDQTKWHIDVPHYTRVRYLDVYPGMDQVFYGQGGNLEYDWIVKPGADPGLIRQEFKGATSLSLNGRGDLVIGLGAGVVTQHKPVIYQEIGGDHRSVEGHYVLLPGKQVGVFVGSYDLAHDLVIDPVLSYSTYLGGSENDYATGVAVDQAGYVYVVGGTSTVGNFPVASGSQAPILYRDNGFVAKLDPTGGRLLYTTFFSTAPDYAHMTPGANGMYEPGGIRAVAVDGQGHAYIAGTAYSLFPTTVGAAQSTAENYPGSCTTCVQKGHGFIAKLNSQGNGLGYSTYLDGDHPDSDQGTDINAIALASDGSVYATGMTNSSTFPTTAGAYQVIKPHLSGGNAFAVQLNPSGTAWSYATYLGGTTCEDVSTAIAVDSSGNAYIGGYTCSTDFPTTPNAFRSALVGSLNGFVSKLSPTGATLVSSTLIGGGLDLVSALALDSNSLVYITGISGSTDLPLVNAFQSSNHAAGVATNALVAKLDLTKEGAAQLLYSTYFGGSGSATVGGDVGGAIAVDATGNATISGTTASPDFPIKDSILPASGVSSLMSVPFVARFDSSGGLIYSMPLSLSKADASDRPSWQAATAVAVDATGAAYVVGTIDADTLYTTEGVIQSFAGGKGDAFVIKIDAAGDARITLGAYPNPSDNNQTINIVMNLAGGVDSANGVWSWCDGDQCTNLPAAPVGQQTINITKTTTAQLAPGTHNLTARYSGDAVNPPLISPRWVQTVYQPRGNSSLTLTTSSPQTVVGQQVNLVLAFNRSNQSCAAGRVVLKDGTGTIIDGMGSVATVQFATTGYHNLTATYGGDSCNTSAISSIVRVFVEPSTPPVAVLASPAAAAKFQAGTSIPMLAYVRTGVGRTIDRVQFNSNDVVLGLFRAPPYQLTWNPQDPVTGVPGVQPGVYVITVQAWDNRGEASTPTPLTIEVVAPTKLGETVSYLHNDVTGSAVAATSESGKLLWKEGYHPYGERTLNQGASSSNRQFFHGKPYDAASGLQYFGARFYDPVLGRFMGTDPKGYTEGDWHSFNRYAFANNNPYHYTDPDGNSAVDVLFLGADMIKLGFAVYSGNPAAITEGIIDVAISTAGVLSPVPGVGEAYKGVRAAEKVAEAMRAAGHAAEEARMLEKGAVAAKKGLYEFEAASGKTYVGQSGNIEKRLAQHEKSGKKAKDSAVYITEISGGKTAREIAEQRRIDQLGGIDRLENKVNPIGPKRSHLLE